MNDQPQKTDAEKLKLFAFEVQKMQLLQDRYFITAAKSRKSEASPDQVRDALNASKKQEDKVKKLVIKVLSPQAELGL
jgi:hypothetical protein